MPSLLIILIAIILFDFILERLLSLLNYRHIKSDLPPELAGVYDQEKYKKSQEYSRATSRFGMVTSTFGLVLVLAMLLLGGFAWFDELARSWVGSEMLVSLLFFGLIFLASDIVNLPFGLYSTFVIEESFGFNKSSVGLYFSDKVKGWLLTIVLGGGILGLILWFYQLTGPNFWLWAWAIISGFSIFMAMFYSSLIVPLFNKQTPLKEGELRQAIEEFSKKAGFELDNVYVIDGSKRSSKANAYFSGLGPKKRIVLYDTLINDLTVEELVAVLAHEIGHYKKKHILQGLGLGVAQSGIMLYVFSLFVGYEPLSQALGAKQHSFHLAMISFAILYSPLSTLLGLAMNMLSRKNEYEADSFARERHSAAALAGGLKKLSRNNLSNLTPHPWYVFFHYSHPPLLARLRALG